MPTKAKSKRAKSAIFENTTFKKTPYRLTKTRFQSPPAFSQIVMGYTKKKL